MLGIIDIHKIISEERNDERIRIAMNAVHSYFSRKYPKLAVCISHWELSDAVAVTIVRYGSGIVYERNFPIREILSYRLHELDDSKLDSCEPIDGSSISLCTGDRKL